MARSQHASEDAGFPLIVLHRSQVRVAHHRLLLVVTRLCRGKDVGEQRPPALQLGTIGMEVGKADARHAELRRRVFFGGQFRGSFECAPGLRM
jgi:hypothetical protein